MKIQVKENVLGTHYWSKCPHKEVSFLKNEHHHDFWIRVECEVTHDDREIEFLMLRIWLQKHVIENYDKIGGLYRFYNRSCEMISNEIKQSLITKYGDKKWKVSVSEDDNCIAGEW